MGVEPTEDIAEMPPNDFEDRARHRPMNASMQKGTMRNAGRQGRKLAHLLDKSPSM